MPQPMLRSGWDERCDHQWQDRFESHLEAIREQLDRCLRGIAANESGLTSLRQHLSVGSARIDPADLANPLHLVAGDQPLIFASKMSHPSQSKSTVAAFCQPKDAGSLGEVDTSLHRVERVAIQEPSTYSKTFWSPSIFSSISIVVSTMFYKQRQRSKLAIELWKLLGEPGSSREATWAHRASALLISLSVILTLYDSGTGWASPGSVIIHFFCDGLFSLELLARFYCCPSRLVFLTEIYTLFEVAASFPILIVRAQSDLDGPLEPNTWPYIVLVAFLPLLRLLMVIRRFEQIHLQLSAFRSAAEALPVMLCPLSILITGFAAILFVAEPRWNIASFSDALWLTIVTCFTVGYGDTIPVSPAGSCIVTCLMVFSALLMAIPIGIVGEAFSRVWDGREALLLVRRMQRRLYMAKIGPNDIAALFGRFGQNEKGEINKAEFIAIIHSMSVNLDDAQGSHLFNIIDADGNGLITEQEFVKVLFPSHFDDIYFAFNSVVDVTKQVATSAMSGPQLIVERVSLPAQQFVTLASETAQLVSGVHPIRRIPTDHSRRSGVDVEHSSNEFEREDVI